MRVDINLRGNGACPICISSESCRIQDLLSQSMDNFSKAGTSMELVIYSCPQFEEKPDNE
jgi:hypothetical protein